MPQPSFDSALAYFLELMDESGGAIDVTLLVGGTVVSGIPCSTSEFYEIAGEHIQSALSNAGHDAANSPLSKLFATIAEDTRDDAARFRDRDAAFWRERPDHELPVAEREEIPHRSYIHLKDVTIYCPGSEPLQAPMWRGRINQVTGWTFGR